MLSRRAQTPRQDKSTKLPGGGGGRRMRDSDDWKGETETLLLSNPRDWPLPLHPLPSHRAGQCSSGATSVSLLFPLPFESQKETGDGVYAQGLRAKPRLTGPTEDK